MLFIDSHLGDAADAYRAGLAVVLDNPVLEGALASALASSLRDLKAFDDWNKQYGSFANHASLASGK